MTASIQYCDRVASRALRRRPAPGRERARARQTWPSTSAPTWTYQMPVALIHLVVDRRRRGAEQIRTVAQRIRGQRRDRLPAVRDQREVVGDHVGQRDRHQRVDERAASAHRRDRRARPTASRARRAGRAAAPADHRPRARRSPRLQRDPGVEAEAAEPLLHVRERRCSTSRPARTRRSGGPDHGADQPDRAGDGVEGRPPRSAPAASNIVRGASAGEIIAPGGVQR